MHTCARTHTCTHTHTHTHTCRVQTLILSPTRELAQQTEKVILAIGEFMNVQAHACIGGKSLGKLLYM